MTLRLNLKEEFIIQEFEKKQELNEKAMQMLTKRISGFIVKNNPFKFPYEWIKFLLKQITDMDSTITVLLLSNKQLEQQMDTVLSELSKMPEVSKEKITELEEKQNELKKFKDFVSNEMEKNKQKIHDPPEDMFI